MAISSNVVIIFASPADIVGHALTIYPYHLNNDVSSCSTCRQPFIHSSSSSNNRRARLADVLEGVDESRRFFSGITSSSLPPSSSCATNINTSNREHSERRQQYHLAATNSRARHSTATATKKTPSPTPLRVHMVIFILKCVDKSRKRTHSQETRINTCTADEYSPAK